MVTFGIFKERDREAAPFYHIILIILKSALAKVINILFYLYMTFTL